MTATDSSSGFLAGAKARVRIIAGTVATLWAVFTVDTVLGHALTPHGVIPRTVRGLWGVLFAPFLHVNFAHLLANTTSLLLVAWLVMMRKPRDFFSVAAISALTAGLGTWLVGGSHTVHVGASGVIFGFLGFIFSRGYFERKLWPIIVSVLSLFLFGGALRGIVPGAMGVSWEGHLFGFLGGILAAKLAFGSREELPRVTNHGRRKARIGAHTSPSRIAPIDTSRLVDADEDLNDELEALRRKMNR